MYTTVKITLLTFCLGLAMGLSDIQRPADLNLMQFMMQSRDVSQSNPSLTLECMQYYVPKLDECTKQFEVNQKSCIKRASDDRLGLDDALSSERVEIRTEAETSCNKLAACEALTNSIEYFSCAEKGGNDNVKSMFTISANSSVLLDELQESYRNIQVEEYRCTNASSRTYQEDWGKTMEDMNSCMLGLTEVPVEPENPEPENPEPENPEPESPEPESPEPENPEPENPEPESPEGIKNAFVALSEKGIPEEYLSRAANEAFHKIFKQF